MRSLILIAYLAAAPAVLAATGGEQTVEHASAGHHFSAGPDVELGDAIDGDAYAVGARVALAAPVAGQAVLGGGQVEVSGQVARGLFAVGGTVVVSGTVHGDADLAGGTVELTPAAKIGGNVTMQGGRLTMAGATDGRLRMTGGDAVMNGTVAGDAEITAGHIEIGREARIAGTLRYRSEQEPVIAAGAQLLGGLQHLPAAPFSGSWREGARHALHGTGGAIWPTGSFVIGALLLLILPGFLRDTSTLAVGEWGRNLGIGFAVVVAVPVAVILLFVTLIGIPLGLLTIAFYVALLLLGYLVGAVALGDFVLGRLAPARAAAIGWRVLALLAVLIALGIVRRVPLVGGWVLSLVFLVGVGALSRRAVHAARPPAAAA